MPDKTVKIDAQGKVLGRLASEIATILMGKDQPDYQPHISSNVHVIVDNCNGIKVTGKKMEQKKYYRHSGYPGGMKEKKLSDISKSAALNRAVRGMLPNNRLRTPMLKKLTLND
ncbi:50S ribosomal protein L13 [Patescibacteria group bacterium]|nr:50S ribosomal protein L13 [Patescibacteria group bacterium]MBU1672837.1 50S ribosomal protein L13 [Patescibacteria group bacterium]MBU1963265.1 50S ribosomal protein L13 [Patescibacteria group bacterium]